MRRDFLSGFSPVPEGVSLPARVLEAYEPVSSLSRREDKLVLLARRRRDSALFVCKRTSEEEAEAEYRTLVRLFPLLPKAVPEPEEFFCEGDAGYLIYAYLSGETLERYRERTGGCSPERCGEIGRELCGLLAVLHSQEPPIIHRDVKPENVLLLPDGGLGLIDFGTARQYAPGQGTDTRLLGTRATAAPEQYGYAQTDGRTDLYAAGCTLLWLAAGTYEREALSSLPRWLGRTLEKAMAFDPADRWPTAGSMGDALARRFPWKKAALGVLAAVCALLLLCLPLNRTPGPRDRVEFSSAVLEAAVRAELELPEGAVTYGDLERVERLAAVGTETFDRDQAFDYRAGPYVGGVWKAETPRGDVSDLSLLARMPNLRELYLCKQEITDIAPLAGLPLVTLALSDNDIADFAPLRDAAFLERLYLGDNTAADHGVLAELGRLSCLNLDSTRGAVVDSFSFLTDMPLGELALRRLHPADGDWTPLSTLERLYVLHLWDAPEAAVEAVHGLPRLTCLTAGNWNGGDLACAAGITALDNLSIYGGLESFAGAEALTNLDAIYVSGGGTLDLAPLAGLPKLRRLELYGIDVRDFSPLSGLESLRELGVDPALEEAARSALPEGAELIIS